MTVKQMIEALSHQPNDATVVLSFGTLGSSQLVEVTGAQFQWIKPDGPNLRSWHTCPIKIDASVKSGVVIR